MSLPVPEDYEAELPWWNSDENDPEPDHVVETGLSNAAKHLIIYYTDDATYVSPSGEYQNAMPWKFAGRISPADVLAEYRTSMLSEP